MQPPILVFDLDGTLVDTAPDLVDALNHALGTAKLPAADPLGMRIHAGRGGRVMIEQAFQAHGRAPADGEMETLLETFLAHYTRTIPGRSQPYPGALDALDRFAAAGFIFAVCTNKFEALARALIGALDLDHRFAAICGADTFAFRKPDPRHLTETIRLAGGSPDSAIMIGDSHTDIATAKAAGIPVIAVDFGYTDRHVREFEPSRVISHFDEITLAMVEDLLAGAAS